METENKVGKNYSIWIHRFQVLGIPGMSPILEKVYTIGQDEIIQEAFSETLFKVIYNPVSSSSNTSVNLWYFIYFVFLHPSDYKLFGAEVLCNIFP